MAGKLNIRRVGSLLPTLCLLVITILGIIVAWLGTFGIPEFLLRYTEEKVAEQGIYVKIDRVRADIVHGLALCVEGIAIYPGAKKLPLPLCNAPRSA